MNLVLTLLSSILLQAPISVDSSFMDRVTGTFRAPTADGYEYIITDKRGKYYYYESGKDVHFKAKGYYMNQGNSLLLRAYDEIPECTYYISEATKDNTLGTQTRITLQNKQGEPLANDSVLMLFDFTPTWMKTDDFGKLLVDFSKVKGFSIKQIHPDMFFYFTLGQINNIVVQVYDKAKEYTSIYNNYNIYPADGGIEVKSYQGFGKYFKRVDDLTIEDIWCN